MDEKIIIKFIKNVAPFFWYAHLQLTSLPIFGPVYMGVGGLQVGEVTRLGGVKQYPAPLHAILQPRYPRVHYLLLNGR